MKYLVYSLTVIVALVIVFGLLAVGSPREARRLRFDAERVNHLSGLQYDLLNFWQAKGKLPSKLAELKDDLRGVSIPTDPETDAEYEYRATGELSFELCAVFALPNEDAIAGRAKLGPYYPEPAGADAFGPGGAVWDHGSGRVCFSRIIDPDFFKRQKGE